MPKTEVILTHNIVGLGGESDQVKVAAGYARNYLFPQGFAIPLSGANKRRLEALKQRRAEREGKELNHMTEMGAALSKMTLLIKVKTGEDGKMFGAVTSGTVADELSHQFDIHLDKRKIHLEHPIRTLGEHEIELRLHTEIVAKLKLKVESTTPPPAVEAHEARGREGAAGPRTEKRGRRPAGAEGPQRTERAEKPADKAAKGHEKAPERGVKPAKPKAERSDKLEKPEKKPKA